MDFVLNYIASLFGLFVIIVIIRLVKAYKETRCPPKSYITAIENKKGLERIA